MNYTRFQNIAKTQIKKFGQLVTFRLVSEEAFDPLEGEVTVDVVEDQVYAVLTNPTFKEYSSGLVQIGDAVLLIDGLSISVTPTDKDTVIVGGEEWNITMVRTVAPSEKVILYKVYIRKS